MSWEVFEKSLAIAQENHIDKINFFGGEPVLNLNFFEMLQAALEKNFFVILATNCSLFKKETLFNKFLRITKPYKQSISIVSARDKFHLKFFDPIEIIKRLRQDDYEVVVQDYANHTVALSEYNENNPELQKLNTNWSCCYGRWTDYLGVLPDGGWTICPPSLEAFGSIFSDSLKEVTSFKSEITLNNAKGCSECLKNFRKYHKLFETRKSI